MNDLKKTIRKENDITITCDARELQPFLARDVDAWLDPSTDDGRKLKRGEQTAYIKALTHEDKEVLEEFGLEEIIEGMPEPGTKQIYVLLLFQKVIRRQEYHS